MKLVPLGLCIAACLGLSSCLTAQYPEPAANVPTALFAFGIGYNQGGNVFHIGGGVLPQYSALDAPCGRSQEIVRIGYFDTQKEGVRIASGKELHIKARSFFHYFSGLFDPSAPKAHWCESVATFTPGLGHSYFVVHGEKVYQHCVLSVRDRASNAPPPDLTIQDNLSCPE